MDLNTWKTIFTFVGFAGAFLVLVSTIGGWVVTSRLDKLKENKIDELVAGKNELLQKIETYQGDLEAKDATIRKLEDKAAKAERGIAAAFDFNGARRVSPRPGHTRLETGPEVRVFERMRELERTQKFTELRELAERQIQATPEWLTPYLFLGVAHANLGNKEAAIRALRHVVANAYGDRAYAAAGEILRRLESDR